MPRSVNYIILNSVLLIKKRMLFNINVLLFIIHFIRFFFQRTCNCKQWLECQQICDKHGFRIGGIKDFYKISLNDVYERLIHAAIQ